jgi:hypothetical protein
METTTESSTSPRLPERWVAKIFQELQGNYGSRFLNQWKTGQVLPDGSDLGHVNAMATWGKKLAGFASQPERIRRVLDDLPADPPSLPQFVELCRMARPDDKPALPHRPTPEEQERARKAAQAAAESVKKPAGFDPMDTWRRPGSPRAVQYLLEGAKTDRRMAAIRDELIQEGVIAESGKANKLWRNGAWSAA